MTLASNGQVAGAPLAASDPTGTQTWRVREKSTGVYEISSVASGKSLGVAPPGGSEIEHTLSVNDSADATTWKLVFNSAGNIEFKPTNPLFDGKAADLSEGNRIILWEENGLQNQTWFWEMLPVGPLRWVAASNGEIPVGAIQGGYDAQGPLYIGRARVPGGQGNPDGTAPGKVAAHFASVGGCIIFYYYVFHKVSNYEVLVGDSDTYVWVPYNQPRNASNILYNGTKMTPVIGGPCDNGVTLWIAQGKVNDTVIPGFASSVYVYLPYDGAPLRETWNGTDCHLLCNAST